MTRHTIYSAVALFLVFINGASIRAQVAPAAKPSVTDEAQAYFSKADAHFYAGRSQEAVEEYQKGLSLNPDVFTAQTNLGLSLY